MNIKETITMQKTNGKHTEKAQETRAARIPFMNSCSCRICGRKMDPDSDYVICAACIADIVYMETREPVHAKEAAAASV